MTDDTPLSIGRHFHAALSTGDLETLKAMLADDIVWTLPGDNQISGEFAGAPQVIAHLVKIAGFRVSVTLRHILASRDNFALSLHNTAQKGDIALDEDLVVVCRLAGGKISRMESFISDLENMDRFYAR